MKIALSLAVILACAGCSSSPRVAQEPQLRQELEIECVASNAAPSGCVTTHDIYIIAPLGSGGGVPSVADLRSPDAGKSEF